MSATVSAQGLVRLAGTAGSWDWFFAAVALVALFVWARERWAAAGSLPWRAGPGSRSATWARARDLKALTATGDGRGRVVLGMLGSKPVAAEPGQSLVVFGPTQSRKTSGLAVPAILGWEGPVVATSVKSDLVSLTLEQRSSRGEAWVFDPTGSTGARRARWSPLECCGSWRGARRVAASLCSGARTDGSGLSDAEFWYSSAAKLAAPILLAAAIAGVGMEGVVDWVDSRAEAEVEAALATAGEHDALRSLRAVWARDERQLSSVYATLESVLEPFAEPWAATTCRIDIDKFLGGGQGTLYVCAPASEQHRLRAVFTALISELMRAAYARSHRLGAPLSPPLLVVLDEAANIAPLADLDSIAATAAGHGIQLVSIWQDLSQLRARYGERAATVVNNHRAKLVLSGISDPPTLELASALAGEEEVRSVSRTSGAGGQRSSTTAIERRRLVTPDSLRRMAPGTALLLYAHLPPARLKLRGLRERSGFLRPPARRVR